MDDRKLEALLQLRNMEEASDGFEARIIAHAYPRRVNEPLVLTLKRILAEFIPQPAYALAAMLILGVALGFGFNPDTSYAQETYFEEGYL